MERVCVQLRGVPKIERLLISPTDVFPVGSASHSVTACNHIRRFLASVAREAKTGCIPPSGTAMFLKVASVVISGLKTLALF